jgi:hypothetical protein
VGAPVTADSVFLDPALRALGAWTVELLMDAIDMITREVTPADAAGWFKHRGVVGAQLA